MKGLVLTPCTPGHGWSLEAVTPAAQDSAAPAVTAVDPAVAAVTPAAVCFPDRLVT